VRVSNTAASSGAGRRWPALPYDAWRATRDTLHLHTQVLGKLAARLAPPERQLGHSALHLSVRGWETSPLPAPDGSGAFVVALDLRAHAAVIEHSDGRTREVPLVPDCAVGTVTRGVLRAVAELAGPVELALRPQEVPWHRPLDEDGEHATYDPEQVVAYFAAATRAAQVLTALRAPFLGRVSAVNAWWGAFDLAVTFFNGRPMAPASGDFITRNSGDAEQIAVGWWPGDLRYPRAAFYAYALPANDRLAASALAPPTHFEEGLGEFVLDWDDVVGSEDPFALALDFGRRFVAQACEACGWDTVLTESALGVPPPVS